MKNDIKKDNQNLSEDLSLIKECADNLSLNEFQLEKSSTELSDINLIDENLTTKGEKLTSLSFWTTIICLVLGLTQTICFIFGVDLKTNIIIDVCAFVLSILVCFGVIKVKSNKISKNDIEQEMKDKLDKDK